uniref:Uncharacterized protein n=1 Tax=Arundo donax TaxID=35708 RepID=A0A0A9H6U8_ARUDO
MLYYCARCLLEFSGKIYYSKVMAVMHLKHEIQKTRL